MGLIYKSLRFRGTRRSRVLPALMDTGVSASFIREREARELGDPHPLPDAFRVQFGKGSEKVRERISLTVLLNGHRVVWDFNVIRGFSESVVIGADFFQRFHIKLDPEREDLIIDPRHLKVKLI